MFEFKVLESFLIAFALGALIGLEREYSQYKGRYVSFAGIRTFPLIALVAALTAYLSIRVSFWLLVASTVAFSALVIIAYYTSSIKSKYHGITTAIAALLTFLVGVLCAYEQTLLAAVVAVMMAIFLYAKNFLHHFTQKIKRKELADTLKFAVIAFVILPFLPNKGYGPYEIFNPFIMWLMVVLVSGISFFGYILMKIFGEKGLELTGLFGGLVSSTAVTTSFAHRSKKEYSFSRALALGVILANSVMFIRVLIEVFALNRELFIRILPVMVLFILVSAVFAYFVWCRAKKISHERLELTSPFTLWPALKFSFFFVLILALIKISDIYLSSHGVYLTSLISGLANVDAIAVSLAQLAKSDLSETIAKNGIIIAMMTSLLVKGGIVYFLGSKQFSRLVLTLFFILLLTGLGAIFLF